MKLALYHGYELSGSGSNEYTRYLARALAEQGHEVVVIAREPAPETLDMVSRAYAYDTEGTATELFRRPSPTPGGGGAFFFFFFFFLPFFFCPF